MINSKKIENLQGAMELAHAEAKSALSKVNVLRVYREELAEKLKHAEKELIEAEQKFFEKNCIFGGSVQSLKDALSEEVDKKTKQ